MKNKFSLLYGLLVILTFCFFPGCKKDTAKKTNQTKDTKNVDAPDSPPQAYKPGTGEYINYNMNDGSVITLQKVNNEYILGGDVILSAAQLLSIQQNSSVNKIAIQNIKPNSTFTSNTILLWPNATIYYTINDAINQSSIMAAIAHYTNNTIVHFVARTTQANYVEFAPSPSVGASGDSQLGMVGGKQQIRLEDNCSAGTVIHEIGHALGLMHEQTRADRGLYINVSDNINSDWISQYQIYSGISGYQTGPFDFDSIMLYGSENEAAEINGNPAPQMTRLDGTEFYGQSYYLSQGDIAGITYLYNKLFIRLRFVNLPVTPVADVERVTQNIYIDFYQNAACTIPETLTIPVDVKYTENLQSWYTNNPHPTNVLTSKTKTLSTGTSSTLLYTNFTTFVDDSRAGNHRSYAYTIGLTGWVGYVTVSPAIRQ